MDVIIMAMSTLPLSKNRGTGEQEIRSSKVDMNGKEVEYYSQTEPASRKILDGITDKNDLKFVILGTRKTRKTETFQYHPEHPKEGEMTGTIHKSAIDFFLMRMGLSSEDERVKVIMVEEENLTPAIEETISYIRACFVGAPVDDSRLWIDTQGGFRNITLVMNAIISLLREDGIEPKKIYSMNYDRNKPVQELVEQTNTYKIFQFVSGINEFRRYGRAEQLEDYYESIGASVPEEIIQMKKIAEAIQMCDMETFDEELAGFRRLASVEKERQGFLNIFWNQIKADYAQLLKADYAGLDVVEWLYKKKFYQQAITYLEAKLPKEWIHIEYLPEEDGTIPGQPASVPGKLLTCQIKMSVLEHEKRWYEEPENCVINLITRECVKWKTLMEQNKGSEPVHTYLDRHTENWKKGISKGYSVEKLQDRISDYMIIYKSKSGRDPFWVYNHVLERNRKSDIKRIEKRYDLIVPKEIKTEKIQGIMRAVIHCEDLKKAEHAMYLILLYKLLKNERNKFNHMAKKDERVDQNVLGRVIRLFIEVGRSVEI